MFMWFKKKFCINCRHHRPLEKRNQNGETDLCAGSTRRVPNQINYITGEKTKGSVIMECCRNLNSRGSCSFYETKN